MRPAGIPVRWRLPVLAGGGISLLAGGYGALLLLDAPVPAPGAPLAQIHGPLMVLGFVGTLVALERAVAVRRRWAMTAPAASAAGAAVLILTGPTLTARLLLLVASVALLGCYRTLWRRQPGPALLAQATGAFGWYAAVLLWLAGLPVAGFVPWLVVFVVATIAGERLELSRVAPRAGAHGWFLAALAALVGGALAATLWPASGPHLLGAGLLAVVAWLGVFDVARYTVRGAGLVRYVAVGLLAGYAWLGLAGLLWLGAGAASGGARYHATLHAVFVGFVLSMIFVHAPVVLPAVLRRPLPYHRLLYAPLALLHVALLARVALGDGLGMATVWRWAGVANVAALLGFAGCAVALSATAGRRGRGARPVPVGSRAVAAGAP